MEDDYEWSPGNQQEDFTVKNSPLLDNRVTCIRIEPGTGALWIGTGSGVNRFDPSASVSVDSVPAQLRIEVYPNPAALTALGVPLRLRGEASRFAVDVLDLAGRRVRHYPEVLRGQVFWDGRDDSGNLVRPGLYFIRAEAGGHSGTARVTLIR